MEKLALLEVVDRDGRVRQAYPVTHWPVRVGRSLECEVVLDDPHVAPRHFSVDHTPEGGVTVTVGETVNGLRCGHKLLAAGSRAVRPSGEEWVAGHTRLRLRLPDEMLAPEQALPQLSGWRTAGLVAVLIGLGLWTSWGEYLDADPGNLLSRLAPVLIGIFALLALWCFLWALGSKIFQHRFDYWTHVRIASTGLLASGVLGAALGVLAYSTSWVVLSRVREPVEALVLAGAVYAHLCAVLPLRRRAFGWGVTAAAVAGLGVAAAFRYHNTGRFTEELYLATLPPPLLRLAPAVSPETFLQGAATMKDRLDKKARESDDDDAAPDGDDSDD